jgi:hypothetical protein
MGEDSSGDDTGVLLEAQFAALMMMKAAAEINTKMFFLDLIEIISEALSNLQF